MLHFFFTIQLHNILQNLGYFVCLEKSKETNNHLAVSRFKKLPWGSFYHLVSRTKNFY